MTAPGKQPAAQRQLGTCHIVCAGPKAGFDLCLSSGDFLISADAGYLTCKEAGLIPDLAIGDFDSMAIEELEGAGCERVTLPRAKDDTDTLAAMREGLARGYTRFAVHCALGGDLGHELANIQSLLFLRAHGARGVLHGQGQRAFALFPEDGELEVATRPGLRVSVFALAGDARGVTERGLRWELENAELSAAFPLGVSNEAAGAHATFAVGEGQLLVVLGSPAR